MKKCGYAKGYCDSPVPCDLEIEGWGEAVAWRKLRELAKACDHYLPRAPEFRSMSRIPRRRRDWRVGNPYGKEGEGGKEY